VIIRDLMLEDMDALAQLYYQFWEEESDTAKMRDKLLQLQKNDAYIMLGAADGDMLVGSVMGIICEELYGDCRPFLVVENMMVDSGHRQKGVGKALFAQLEKMAKDRGCAQNILVTKADRKNACGFYESIGFHPTANKGYKKKL